MLRTTISRIRKVCAFVPRVLRDDLCNVPAACAVLRKVYKSTNSSDDGSYPTEKGTTTPLDYTTGIPLTHRERCQKIIDQAFGAAPVEPDKIISEQYCSQTVNIENTRREIQEAEKERIKIQEQKNKIENPIIPDDRQYGIFKMSRELIKDDEDEDEIIVEENMTPTHSATTEELVKTFNAASAREPHLTEDSKETQEQTAPLKEPNLDCAKEDHDLNISNPETPDTVTNDAAIYDEAEAKTVDTIKKDRNPDLCQSINPNYKRFLNITTAKEEEEKLAQKLETIEETPLVEAQRPSIEGFNASPRVLGNKLDPHISFKHIDEKQSNFHGVDLNETLDEVAKRCLNGPIGKLDEMLLNEMEKVGISIIPNKTPSTAMGDELVQMDLCDDKKQQMKAEIFSKSAESEDNEEESGACDIILSRTGTHHMCMSEVRLPDLDEQAEEMSLLKSEDIKPVVERKCILHSPQVKETKPLFCDSKPTVKLPCYRKSELNEDKMEKNYHILPSQEVKIISNEIDNKSALNKIAYLQSKGQKSAPNATTAAPLFPKDKETMQALHSSIFRQITERFTNGKSVKRVPLTAKEIKPSSNAPNVSPLPSASKASGKIGSKTLFKHEYRGVRRPSHYGIINASHLAEHDQRTLAAEKDTKNKNSVYSRYLSSPYAWGQAKEKQASKFRHKNEIYDELGKVESHRRVPEYQPNTLEEQAVLDEKRNAANGLVERLQFTKLNMSGGKWDSNIKKSPDKNVGVEPCSDTLHSVEDSGYDINLKPKKVTLPEELMKEHELDPYYVLTCNETCPISPGPSLSACGNTDFVDTTETIYMKKNICESARPKPLAENMITPFENVMAGAETYLNQPKLDVKSLMTQYENLTADTQAQRNKKQILNKNDNGSVQCNAKKLKNEKMADTQEDTNEIIHKNKNISKSVQPQCKTVPADTQAQLNQDENIREIVQPKLDAPQFPKLQEEAVQTYTETQLNKNKYISEFQQPQLDPTQSKQQCDTVSANVQAPLKHNENISESVQPKRDVAQSVKPQRATVTARELRRTSVIIPDFKVRDMPIIKPRTTVVVSPEPRSLPNTQQVSLTEILRRVREKSRRQYTRELALKVDPIEGKCRRKAPRCSPTGPRSPPANPVPLPSFGLPMVKRRPKVCTPKKKGGGCCNKCAACDIDVACGVQLGEICPEIACALVDAEASTAIESVDLTEVVNDHVQTWGKILGGMLRRARSNVETLMARDYEPWSPIPSWPIPKKIPRPYENWMPGKSGVPPCVRGCPVSPKARASMNPEPPCNLKPCKGFPKRRSFSALDCFAVSLGQNKVYDLGQF